MNGVCLLAGLVIGLGLAGAVGAQTPAAYPACAEFVAAEQELAQVSGHVRASFHDDADALARFEAAQAAWAAFRDRELAVLDSAGSACRCSDRVALISARIDQLARWLAPAGEEPCPGP